MSDSEITPSASSQSKRIGQIIRLKRSALADYKALHASAWPSVLAAISRSNITDYSIYLDETSMILFASFKYVGNDWEGDMRRMRDDEDVKRWWEVTDGMQESFVEGAVGSADEKGRGWWKDLEEVFRVE